MVACVSQLLTQDISLDIALFITENYKSKKVQAKGRN